jgi:hypothetical protein
VTKRIEEWTTEELRAEAVKLIDELARRVATPATAKKPRTDVVLACENWVRGRAWDETFTREMVEDEFAVLERKAGRQLGVSERERLLQLWLALYSERYRSAA